MSNILRKQNKMIDMTLPSDAYDVIYGNSTVGDELDKLKAHDLTNRVSISSYTSSNKYTCPSDGYIFVSNETGYTGYIVIDSLASIGAATGRFSTFVRKGTQVWIEGTVTSAFFSSLQ